MLGLEPHHLEHRSDTFGKLPPGGQAVDADRLRDDATDRHPGVQRRVGVLEDDLRLPPERQEPPGWQRRDVLVFEEDAPAGRLDGAQDEATGGRLAAAALADEPQRLPRGDREADAVDRADDALSSGQDAGQETVAEGKVLREVLDRE